MKPSFFKPALCVLFAAVTNTVALAAPTAMREWSSSSGTKLQAVANEIKNGTVEFLKADGKLIKVPLAKLTAEDQAFLEKHFAPPPPPPAAAATNLPWPAGQVTEQLATPEGKHCLVYLPTTLKADRSYPLLMVITPGGGTAGHAKKYVEAAEVGQCVVCVSVESKNGEGKDQFKNNTDATNAAISFVCSKMNINKDRLYFTGESGGGRMALAMAKIHNGAGVMPIIAGHGSGPNSGDVPIFFLDGTTDYNRYEVASGSVESKKVSTIRYYDGGHKGASSELHTEGLIWLMSCSAKKLRVKSPAEVSEWENAVMDLVDKISPKEPGRALLILQRFQEKAELTGQSKTRADTLLKPLNASGANKRYVEGVDALVDFARKVYGPLALSSKLNFNEPKSSAEAKKLAEKFADVPEIQKLALGLSESTGK